MCIPNHRRLRCAHASPALQRSMVLVDGRHHHCTNVERFLVPVVGHVRQYVAHTCETFLAAVRIGSHVTGDGIGRLRPPWEPLTRRYVGVIVMAEQEVAGFINVPRPVLDRKSTRLNSSHLGISYAVFCLKKKKLMAGFSWGLGMVFAWGYLWGVVVLD